MKPCTFEEAVRQYEPMLKAQIRSLSLYREWDEYYQCALVALWKAYEKFEEGKGHFGAYAKQTVRGYLLVHLKREKRQEERFSPMEGSVFDLLPAAEKRPSIRLDELGDAQRHIITAFFYEEKSLPCIAQEMGLTYHQTRHLYRTALKQLQAGMARGYV